MAKKPAVVTIKAKVQVAQGIDYDTINAAIQTIKQTLGELGVDPEVEINIHNRALRHVQKLFIRGVLGG